MADNILYSLYMKSSLYRPKEEASIDIEIGDEFRNKHLYEPNNRNSMYVEMNDEDDAFKSDSVVLRKSNRSLSRSLPDLVLTTKAKNSRHSSDLCTNNNTSHCYLDGQPVDLNEEIKMNHSKFEEETKVKFNVNSKQALAYPLPRSFEHILNLAHGNLSNLSYISGFNLPFFYNQSLAATNSGTTTNAKNGWLSSMFSCLVPIWTNKGKKPNTWEIPFDSIRNLEWISSGSQGVVFKGYLNNRLIAVKKVREKSETEIKHLKRLKHKNVINFLGVCTVPPCYCVVMEYCTRGPLSDILMTRKDQIEPDLISEWANQIANGMHYLHTNAVIHRDLSDSLQ